MARGDRRDQRCVEQLADAAAGNGGIIGDDGEFALFLPHQLVQQPLRRADAHEAADHDGRPIGDHRDGFFCGNGFHGGLRCSCTLRQFKTRGKGRTLIWVKGSTRSRRVGLDAYAPQHLRPEFVDLKVPTFDGRIERNRGAPKLHECMAWLRAAISRCSAHVLERPVSGLGSQAASQDADSGRSFSRKARLRRRCRLAVKPRAKTLSADTSLTSSRLARDRAPQA